MTNLNLAYLSSSPQGGGGGETEKVSIVSKDESKLNVVESYRDGVHLFELEPSQSIMPSIYLHVEYGAGMSGDLRIVDSYGNICTYESLLEKTAKTNQIFLFFFQKWLTLVECYNRISFSATTDNNTYTVVLNQDNSVVTFTNTKGNEVDDDWFDADSQSESKTKAMDEKYLNINGLNDYFAHKVVLLTQEEYDGLSDANKNNGCLYLIAD